MRPWFNQNTFEDSEWEVSSSEISWDKIFPGCKDERIIIISDKNSSFSPVGKTSKELDLQ